MNRAEEYRNIYKHDKTICKAADHLFLAISECLCRVSEYGEITIRVGHGNKKPSYSYKLAHTKGRMQKGDHFARGSSNNIFDLLHKISDE